MMNDLSPEVSSEVVAGCAAAMEVLMSQSVGALPLTDRATLEAAWKQMGELFGFRWPELIDPPTDRLPTVVDSVPARPWWANRNRANRPPTADSFETRLLPRADFTHILPAQGLCEPKKMI